LDSMGILMSLLCTFALRIVNVRLKN